MEYTIAVYTDKGIQKATNQDSLCLRRVGIPGGGELLFAAVCDGMGGLQKGEVASAEVVRSLEQWFDANRESLVSTRDFSPVRRQLTELLRQLDQKIAAYAAGNGVQMGSTLTALLAVNHHFLTVNVGDSRIYCIHGGKIRQLTQDQSLVEMEIQRGRITRDEARHHPQRNVLLQCIGIGRELTPAFTEGTVETGGVYLLCSDGFCHELEESEIVERLSPRAMEEPRVMQNALFELTERCKNRGESDNITAVICKARESTFSAPAKGGLLRRLRQSRNEEAPPTSLKQLESAHILHSKERL